MHVLHYCDTVTKCGKMNEKVNNKQILGQSNIVLSFYHLFNENKKTAKPLIGKIHIDFKKEAEVSVLPSPERQLVQRTEYQTAPEILEKSLIAKGHE